MKKCQIYSANPYYTLPYYVVYEGMIILKFNITDSRFVTNFLNDVALQSHYDIRHLLCEVYLKEVMGMISDEIYYSIISQFREKCPEEFI